MLSLLIKVSIKNIRIPMIAAAAASMRLPPKKIENPLEASMYPRQELHLILGSLTDSSCIFPFISLKEGLV